MPPYPQWPELLEEQAYLVQMLSEVSHDPGALEHTCALLEVLRTELRTCIVQLADLEREKRESSPKNHDSRIASSASKLYHRVAATISSEKDKEKHGHGEDEKQERLLAVWTTKRTLNTLVKNLELKAQILRRQKRHHDELQRRLASLYASIPEERKPPNREEEAEEDAYRAQRALYEIQKTLDRHMTLASLLQHGDYALINAGRHLTLGGLGGSSGVDAAKRCAVQTSVVVDQARRLDPSFFEQEDAQVLKPGWLRDVFQKTSGDDSHPPPLLQALKPHHTALLSLISRAQKRTNEYDTLIRRAMRKHSETKARKDSIKRQALVARARAEAERAGEMSIVDQGLLETDVLAPMRDITAGLEGVIPIAVAQRSSAGGGSPRQNQEPQRAGQDQSVSRRSPLTNAPLLAPQQSRLHLPSKLTPDPSSSPASSALVTPSSSSEPNTQAQQGSADTRSRPAPALAPAPAPAPALAPPASAPAPAPAPAPAARQSPPTDLTQRQYASLSTIRQPKPIPQNNRHPILELQYDQQFQSGSRLQLDGGSRPQSSPAQVAAETSDRDDAIFQSQPQPYQGQPFLQDVQLPPPSIPAEQPIQKIVNALQPPALIVPNPNADTHLGPLQAVRLGAVDPRQMLPPASQTQSIRPIPQITSAQQSDVRQPKPNKISPSSTAQSSRSERQSTGDPSSFPSINPLLTVPTSPSPASAQRLRQPAHGILKQAPSPVTPRPSATADADPWGLGVKVAAASSRPQPKLKTVFSLWRNQNAGSDTSRTRASAPSSQSDPQHLQPPTQVPKAPNSRAAGQVLRFVEAVEIIPRPAIDSDPYEDEGEDENESLPPSPKRGSEIWLQGVDDNMKDFSDESGGDSCEMERRPDVAAAAAVHQIPVNTVILNPSQSSMSSVSSSHFTEFSAHTTTSSMSTTPPPSSLSPPVGYSPPYIPSYYTSQDDGWTLARYQSDTPRRESEERKRRSAGVYGSTSWLGGSAAQTTSPQELQPTVGPTLARPEDQAFHDNLRTGPMDARSQDDNNKWRLLSPAAVNVVAPTNTLNPAASSHMHNNPSRKAIQGGVKSDHELLQAMFPSPAQTTVSHRDLTFSL